MKKTFFTKFTEIEKTFEFCDIWRIRFLQIKRFTLCQWHASCFTKKKLVCFVSDILQDFVKKTDIVASFCSNHSSTFFNLINIGNSVGIDFYESSIPLLLKIKTMLII